MKKGGYFVKNSEDLKAQEQEKELAELKEKYKKNKEEKKELVEKDKKNEKEKKELMEKDKKNEEEKKELKNHISLMKNENEYIKRSLNAGTGGVRKSNRHESAEASYRLFLCSKI